MDKGGGLFRRQGGKTRQKKIIFKYFPSTDKYDTYVEPFFGGGTIGMEAPQVKKMVAGDTDTFVINMFKDFKSLSVKQLESIDLTPDREKFNRLKDEVPKSKFGRFYKGLYLGYNSFGGNRKTYNNKRKTGRTGLNFTRNIEKYKEQLEPFTIMKKDYKYMINTYDSPTTFFYLDPPYASTDVRTYETGNIDHPHLAKMLRNIKGLFMLSHNDTPYIRGLYKGFRFIKYSSKQTDFTKGGIREVSEVLILNY